MVNREAQPVTLSEADTSVKKSEGGGSQPNQAMQAAFNQL